MTDGESVTIWRCKKCDKWSHAVRRPESHLRLAKEVRRGEEVVEDLGNDGREGEWLGAYVRCGPFLAWKATSLE